MFLYGSPDCYSVSRTFCNSHVSGTEDAPRDLGKSHGPPIPRIYQAAQRLIFRGPVTCSRDLTPQDYK